MTYQIIQCDYNEDKVTMFTPLTTTVTLDEAYAYIKAMQIWKCVIKNESNKFYQVIRYDLNGTFHTFNSIEEELKDMRLQDKLYWEKLLTSKEEFLANKKHN